MVLGRLRKRVRCGERLIVSQQTLKKGVANSCGSFRRFLYEQMIDAIHHAYEVMINNLSQAHAGTLLDISNALQTEEQINQLRNQLREAEIEDIEQNKTNYQTSVYYLDIVSELEKMGDFMINISQALERAFIK